MNSPRKLDPVDLELFNNRLSAVAEEMGVVLQRAAFSPNIKDRRDFSCALFDAGGNLTAHAAHIPVHLGSTPLSLHAALQSCEMKPGDVIMLNDPYAGGTHLPDITLLCPVFRPGATRPYAYLADRAHHADVGGSSPGSMALASEIFEEGLRIPPVHLCRNRNYVKDTLSLFLANTRVSEERRGDLDAQVAALRAGEARVLELANRFGPAKLSLAMSELQSYSQRLLTAMLKRIPEGRYCAQDSLDDDGSGRGPIAIRVCVTRRKGRLVVDFAGSDTQGKGPLNANLAVTTSAVFYVVACLAGRDIPANAGMMKAVEIRAPEGSIVNCRFPAAVAGGNVETSQRIVDVLLRALASALPGLIPAASCGTMSNMALGGYDPQRKRFYSYYETVGGGAGAGPRKRGADAVQTHMTNTLNTPIETLESYYPLKVRRYRVRRGSGGKGLHRGGDGIERCIEATAPARLTLLAERHERGPYGLAGGACGKPGRAILERNGRKRRLPSKLAMNLHPGDSVTILSPGGGGWGTKDE